MTRPFWLGRAVRNRHRHAIEQASRRWRTRRKMLISTQATTAFAVCGAFVPRAAPPPRRFFAEPAP